MEWLDNALSSYQSRVETIESSVDVNDQVMDILNDAYPYASSNDNEQVGDDVSPTMDSEAFDKYERRLKMPNKNYTHGVETFWYLRPLLS